MMTSCHNSPLASEVVGATPSSRIAYLSLDLETFSSVDLTKCGVYKYCESDDFEILLFGYSVNGGAVKVVDLANGEKVPGEVLKAIEDESVIKWAYNANFERVCLSRYLGYSSGEYLNPKSWRCSLTWAATLGLPLSLASVGAVLGLEKQKLTEGKELIKYFCTPPRRECGGDKWIRFKDYNKRDVEVEMQIQQKLSKFPVPDFVWDEYHLSEEINDRGIGVDIDFVRQAISFDERSHGELSDSMKELTDLDNPNSVAQMKAWLLERGVQVDTLGKKAVAKLLHEVDEDIGVALGLRQQMARSSVKKYTAMQKAICKDGRVRGMFMFYGANRTGRFAGRLVQLQNLRRNEMPDIEVARSLVACGDYEATQMLYEDIPDTLSQLIRTAFIPRGNKKFIVADFSAIEARVIAWLAGEEWKNKAFAENKDLYCSTASQMFHVPVEKHGINGHLRQKGKITELACIAEGSLVLTNEGLIPIENVTTDQLIWDGESWVTHDGVIYKGIREVITYDGLTATRDHYVWVEGRPQPVRFETAAQCGAHLIQTGNRRQAIRLGENNITDEVVEQENEPLLCFNAVPRMWKGTMAKSRQFKDGEIKRMPALLTTETNTEMVGQTINCGKTEMRKSKRLGIQKLRSKGNQVRFSKRYCSGDLPNTTVWYSEQENGAGQNRYQRKLYAGQSEIFNEERESIKQEDNCIDEVRSNVLALRIPGGYTQTFNGNVERGNNCGCAEGCVGKTEVLEANIRKTRVYDIRNAGRHHRFTVSDKLVHNCGYGGSVGALKAMGAIEMGLSEDELKPLVDAWRASNPHIVSFWWDVDRAVKTAIKDKTSTEVGNIRFSYQSGFLFITLPSGRRLAYIRPRIEPNNFGGESVTYEGVGMAKKWERLESYGPKFVENIVQAVSRDILMFAMKTLRCCSIVAHVHDEVIIEASKDMSLSAVCERMGRTPPWADGLLLRADGYECDFYKKD